MNKIKKQKKETSPLYVSINTALWEKLDDYSIETRISKSAIIEQLLKTLFEKDLNLWQ